VRIVKDMTNSLTGQLVEAGPLGGA
jgi:hypothetical protein